MQDTTALEKVEPEGVSPVERLLWTVLPLVLDLGE
jgi:hypothetical protein